MTGPAPRILIAIGAALLVAHLAAMEAFRKPDGRVVFGDATHHFVQLRSLVFDRDVHFQNEYTRLYGLTGETPGIEWVTSELTITGHVRNYMPVGPALLWLPLYLVVAAAQVVLSALGLASPPDGFDRVLQLTPGITGVIATTLAALLSLRIARRFVDSSSACLGVIAAWLGSHAVYYSLVSPAYSHSASMLANALFFARWLETRESPSTLRFASWGGLAGLAALMRWQDAILLGCVGLEIVRARAPLKTRLIGALAAGGAFAVVFSPQMAVWTVLYGQPLALPQGAGFMQWTGPHLVDVLVSSYHGLFSWAPVLIVALWGLAGLIGRHRQLALPLIYIALASWYVNAAVVDWWAGEAFGARRFLSLFPLFAAGLAWWVHAPERQGPSMTRAAVAGLFIATNGLLLLQYQIFMKGLIAVAPYPAGLFDMYVVRYVVPFRLASWWLGSS